MQTNKAWISHGKPTDRARAAAQQGLLISSDHLDVPPAILSRLAKDGELRRVRRGVYLGADVVPHPLVEAAAVLKKTPRAVVGGLTALEFYGLTTAWPDGVWVLAPRDQHAPQQEGLHVIRVKPERLVPGLGIDTISVHGVELRITGPVRTVLDCWRSTRRVSHTVALEALQALRGSRHWDGTRLYRLARSLGQWPRLRPYVEAMG